ncbi:SDR family NAD(P)-dependent oxidoreductase [Chelatococcus asaccharovorans]|uniref:SDR family NAD(P)-dependent oxidoreductase n=1 Tax=Chelatococcus asaccharovorans TaxID=28210 RepID=UPI00224C6F31|nr:SDR family NAD(P)-dependent oxidoreductase [Chelatococcus asaccharovorans]CAH1664800.1 Short-chain dehydrogenase [Chelatococcus asaccharovorans]CAH1682236.1 Short-chain dehydrogenase [Chelatococcus asaccharovorans]
MASYPDLAGKIVVITGSSKALGADTARAFARQGARVAVNGRDMAAIDALVDAIEREGGEAIGVAADVTSATDLLRLSSEVRERLGSVDILACFAGGMGQPVPVLGMDEALWRQTLDVDLTSKFLAVRAFAPIMREQGSGAIILMNSTSGRLVSEASAAYGAAQAGTLMFMRHLAHELGPLGVRVNAIAPSIVRNEKMERGMPPDLQQQVAKTLPLRRLGEPADIAEAAMFLASNASSWITGQVIDVNGGKVML